MIAGSLAVLDSPLSDPIDSYYADADDRLPALHVDRSQSTLDGGGPIQSGQAAGRVQTTTEDVSIAHDHQGDPGGIMVDRDDARETVTSEWVADPTESGLIAASSLRGPPEGPFPFRLFEHVTGRTVERQVVDVRGLHLDWLTNDGLDPEDVWMVGSESDDGSSIDYHGAADADVRPSIGLGFERPWSSGTARGVVYQSGYCAVYSASSPGAFVRFVCEELLEYCDRPESEEAGGEQSTLGGGDGAQ